MKKHLQKLTALAIILTVSAVVVSANTLAAPSLYLRINVPFDFQVGNQSFAAGDYRIRRTQQNVLVIESQDTKAAGLVLGSSESDIAAHHDEFELTFMTYGETHFLRSVTTPSITFAITKSNAEKEMGKNASSELTKLTFN